MKPRPIPAKAPRITRAGWAGLALATGTLAFMGASGVRAQDETSELIEHRPVPASYDQVAELVDDADADTAAPAAVMPQTIVVQTTPGPAGPKGPRGAPGVTRTVVVTVTPEPARVASQQPDQPPAAPAPTPTPVGPSTGPSAPPCPLGLCAPAGP